MKLEKYQLKFNYLHPKNKLQEKQQRCLDYEQKLRLLFEQKMNVAKQKLALRIERMKGLSPLTKLNQGFSFVSNQNGVVVKSIENVKKDDILSIYVTDGIVQANVLDVKKEEYNGK